MLRQYTEREWEQNFPWNSRTFESPSTTVANLKEKKGVYMGCLPLSWSHGLLDSVLKFKKKIECCIIKIHALIKKDLMQFSLLELPLPRKILWEKDKSRSEEVCFATQLIIMLSFGEL